MLTIREIAHAETALLAQVFRLRVLAREAGGYITAAKYPDGWYDAEDEWATHFGAFEDGVLVGAGRVAFYQSVAEHPYFPAIAHLGALLPAGAFAYLSRWVVHPGFTSRGIAMALREKQEALAAARGLGVCLLDTRALHKLPEYGYRLIGMLDTDRIRWELEREQYLMAKEVKPALHVRQLLPGEAARLPEIYELRVLAWEQSERAAFVNRSLYPQGWTDALDAAATHFIVEANGNIVAAARVNVLRHPDETGEAFGQFSLPDTRPFAHYSRLVVHPDYRNRGLRVAIDDTVADWFERSPCVFMVGLCGTEARLQQCLEMNFRILGIAENYYGPSTYIILHKQHRVLPDALETGSRNAETSLI